MMIRASRTPTKTVNRILLQLAPPPKCRTQANHSCGSMMARSPLHMKKRRNSRNMPRSNPPNPQQPVKGNVGSDNSRPGISVGLYNAHPRTSHHPCFSSRSVFPSTPTGPLTTPSRATPIHFIICNLSVLIFLFASFPEGHSYIVHCVFRPALLIAAFFLYMNSTPVPSTVLS